MDPRSQLRFAELLRYFQRGTFSTFARVVELAFGAPAAAEPYFVANLLLASQICGLCEASVATGTTQWWVSHDGDILINSRSPKVVGASETWLAHHSLGAVPLIATESDFPLILGSRIVHEARSTFSIFDRPLTEIAPTFRSVEHQLCKEVAMSGAISGAIEVFLPSVWRWEATQLADIKGAVLFRVREPFAGFSYYIQHTQLSLRFRALQPEWAFVIAFSLLPWSFSDLAHLGDSSVCLPRAIRLPTIFYRSLFASSESARIGATVRFLGVRPDCISGLTHYFKRAELKP